MAVLASNPSEAEIVDGWNTDGWVVVPSFLEESEVREARGELQEKFPDVASVWREPDPELKAEQAVGLTPFPFRGQALNRLAFNEKVADLAKVLLRSDDVFVYLAHAWAKYAGAANYDQELHRDFRNHTLTIPDQRRLEYAQVEIFLYLADVTDDMGPTHLVSRRHTEDLPLTTDYLPRGDYAEMYEHEESAAAGVGSLLIYAPDVVHRGTNLLGEGVSRFLLATGYQRSGRSWMGYHCWPRTGSYPELIEFIETATPGQLGLLGFPRPDDAFWTDETVAAVRQRYPGIALDAYLKSR